ncbi:MAG: hypothetical protein HFF62_04060 [Oscillospiraceae bacterium]|nr:hypothetical protein [Oscillospiraceae bacterium]
MKNRSEKKFTIRPQIEVSMTQQDIDDIMVTALEGGINYWCRKAKVVGEYLGECASEQISRGGTLVLYDAESSDKWELTLEKFLNGVKMYFEQGCHVQVEDNAIDAGDIDAGDADCIIQFALFGKEVFG